MLEDAARLEGGAMLESGAMTENGATTVASRSASAAQAPASRRVRRAIGPAREIWGEWKGMLALSNDDARDPGRDALSQSARRSA